MWWSESEEEQWSNIHLMTTRKVEKIMTDPSAFRNKNEQGSARHRRQTCFIDLLDRLKSKIEGYMYGIFPDNGHRRMQFGKYASSIIIITMKQTVRGQHAH